MRAALLVEVEVEVNDSDHDDDEAHQVDGDEFTGGLLDLPELAEEVPEARLCDDLVGCEDTHAVEFWAGVLVGRELAADDLVFCESTHLDWVKDKGDDVWMEVVQICVSCWVVSNRVDDAMKGRMEREKCDGKDQVK